MIGFTNTTFASSYEEATKATTVGEITFTENGDPEIPVDPENPNIPVVPVEPVNPENAELMISYVSDFRFGEQDKSLNSWQALADTVYVNKEKKQMKEIVPFITTKDIRGSSRKGWILTVTQNDDFRDENGEILKGAELQLSGLHYPSLDGAPAINADTITIGKEAQAIVKANETTGVGQWSLALGELKGEEQKKTTGITLNVPETTAKKNTTYSTSLTWELIADPFF